MIRDTIRSILAQTVSGFELIIVDDGSTDNTREVVSRFEDPRIRYIEKKNGGQSSARNLGIRESEGGYLSFCDDDDLFYPNHLAVLMQCLEEHEDAALAYSDGLRTHIDGSGSPEVPFSIDFDKRALENYNYITMQSILLRRPSLESAGPFSEDPELRNGLEDWEFLLRLSDFFPFRHVRQVTSEYRVHSGNSFQANSGYDYPSAFFFVRKGRFEYLLRNFGPHLFDRVDHMYPFHLVQSYINVGRFSEARDQAAQLASLYKTYSSEVKKNQNPVAGLTILFSLGLSHFAGGLVENTRNFFRILSTSSLYKQIKASFDTFVSNYAKETPDRELRNLLIETFASEPSPR